MFYSRKDHPIRNKQKHFEQISKPVSKLNSLKILCSRNLQKQKSIDHQEEPSTSKLTAKILTFQPIFPHTEYKSENINKPPLNQLKSNDLNTHINLVANNIKSRQLLRRSTRLQTNPSLKHTEVFPIIRNYTPKPLSTFQDEIRREIAIVNSTLQGKSSTVSMSANRKRHYTEEEKENIPIKFPHVPQSHWVFQTPPNRKLNFSKIEAPQNGIQPVVLQEQTKVVYEMNKNISVDLSQFTHRQEISIDKRYMVEVSDNNSMQEQNEKTCDGDPYELENHFLSLTCRPKKAYIPSKISTNSNILKRKRAIFEPDQEQASDFDANLTFIDENLMEKEESFRFKFTPNNTNSNTTTGHLFDFDGNKKESFNFRF